MTKTTMFAGSLLLCMLATTGFKSATTAARPINKVPVSTSSNHLHPTFASVSVSGPWNLSMCDQGVWTASVSGVSGPFTYEWYLTVPGTGTEQPATYYVGGNDTFITYLDYWITYPDRSSISLTVDVYNASGYAGSGFRSVYAYPCP